jgi:hypothetical protein
MVKGVPAIPTSSQVKINTKHLRAFFTFIV